jgi:protein-S-isoprenylcysteine O-methyltransferase Ste14
MKIETVMRICIAILLVSGFTISGYFRRKASLAGEEISMRPEGLVTMILLRLFGFAGWISIILFVIQPAWLRWSEVLLPNWIRWFGAALSLLAIPLLFWMFQSLGKNITHTIAIREEHSLVQRGPYRWIRHPLYTFGAMFASGLLIMTANWFIAILMFAGSFFLALRTPVEEKKLLETFGQEYQEYMQETGRFLPRMR